jgi:CheY-like chemotaxis protein
MHILSIDDQSDFRELLATFLAHEGYTILSAANGREALSYLRRSRLLPDLILLDIAMPVMSGWDFLREQQRDPLLSSIPVVLLTARDDFDHEAAACVIATLQKPINLDTLLATVRECAELSLSNA